MREVAGKEARFLSGFDAYLFDSVPEDLPFELKKHGTILKIHTFPIEKLDFVQNSLFLPQEKNPQGISILVILCKEAGESALEVPVLNALLSKYDVVIARYNSGKGDTFAYYKAESNIKEENLGIMVDPENPVEGALLALNWKNGTLFAERFDYQSLDGVIPAISQFPAQD